MAFEWNVIAIRWREGKYSVIADEIFNSGIDWGRLGQSAPMRDIPIQPGSYIDQATVVAREELRPHLTSERARAWFDGPAAGADMFVIHRAEWESGLS